MAEELYICKTEIMIIPKRLIQPFHIVGWLTDMQVCIECITDQSNWFGLYLA